MVGSDLRQFIPVRRTASSYILDQTQPPEGQIVVVNVTVWSTIGNIVAFVVPSPSCESAVVGTEESEFVVEF